MIDADELDALKTQYEDIHIASALEIKKLCSEAVYNEVPLPRSSQLDLCDLITMTLGVRDAKVAALFADAGTTIDEFSRLVDEADAKWLNR